MRSGRSNKSAWPDMLSTLSERSNSLNFNPTIIMDLYLNPRRYALPDRDEFGKIRCRCMSTYVCAIIESWASSFHITFITRVEQVHQQLNPCASDERHLGLKDRFGYHGTLDTGHPQHRDSPSGTHPEASF